MLERGHGCAYFDFGVEHVLSALVEELWPEEESQTFVEVVCGFFYKLWKHFQTPFDSKGLCSGLSLGAVGAGRRGSLAG